MSLPVVIQAAGLLAVVAGLALLLPPGWFLLVSGALAVAGGTAAEVAYGRLGEPSGRRDAVRGQGSE